MSQELDETEIQDSFSWRSVYRARRLAMELIDQNGQIHKKKLFAVIEEIKTAPYSLLPNRHYDDPSQRHILKILTLLHDEPELKYALMRISKPHSHYAADRLIKETLLLPEKTFLKDMHARQAALAALLTWLRQNVGSCFATAPAILILQNQPLQFLADIQALLGTGRLSRVIEGNEYAVPLSHSWGSGQLFQPIMGKSMKQLVRSPGLIAAFQAVGLTEPLETLLAPFEQELKNSFSILTAYRIIKTVLLNCLTYKRFLTSFEAAKGAFKSITDNALLKAWEFTLASFAESKANFVSWNLYSSLGLHPEEENGIGRALYEIIQEKIAEINREIEESQSKYDHLFAQAKYLEGRVKRASEKEMGWITAEHYMRRQEINRLLSERDEAYEKGRRLMSFFTFMIKWVSEKFKEYFQEVYDAEMFGETTSPYDDSPAGFRLLYKHGRSNTALWTYVYEEGEFTQVLSSFFNAIEIELIQTEEAKGLQHEVGEMITAIIRKIKEPTFVQEATARLVNIYRDPRRKPWEYVSGGTMSTLVSCYYNRTTKPTEEQRWVENETELLVFLMDAVKSLPLSFQNAFRKDPEKGILAFSPTHAYIVKPGYQHFQMAWESDLYPYTWIRDRVVHPGQDFLDVNKLGEREIDFFIEKLLLFIPEGYRPIVKRALVDLPSSLYPFDLRESVIKMLSYEKWLGKKGLQLVQDELDSLLFEHLPLFTENQVHERLEALFQEMEEIDLELTKRLVEALEKLEVGRFRIFSSKDLYDMAKSLLISILQTPRTHIPYHGRIVQTMQRLGFRAPSPLIFGDTNWVKKRMAFLVNPGSRELELWCVDESGCEGSPLSIWKPYLDGRKKENWGLYISPQQYGQTAQ